MALTDHGGGWFLCDEERYNLHAALEDFHYARSFLRRIGEEERERFSECQWCYGDPSYYGSGSMLEVFDAQFAVLLYSLFGRAFEGELFCEYLDLHDTNGTPDFFEEMAAVDGGPVVPNHSPVCPPAGLEEEIIIAEIRGCPEGLSRLLRLIRRAEGEGGATRLYRWLPHTERARLVRPKEALLLVYTSEVSRPDEVVRHQIFEKLIRAWKEDRRRG